MNLNKETKQEISVAIGDLYRATRKMNILAGNGKLCKDRLATQLATVEEELVDELAGGLNDECIGAIADAVIDGLVTCSEAISIIDGNDSITQDNPLPQYLNPLERPLEQLIPEALYNLENNNYIDLLGNLEDMTVVINAPMCENIKSVIESNNSKFIKVDDLDESEHTEFSLVELIESEGRYEDVYSEIVEVEGTEWVVFKSKYDKKNNRSFPRGKFVKPTPFFIEPTIVVYD